MVLASSRARFIAQWAPAILGFIVTIAGLSSLVGLVTAILLAVIVTLALWIVSYRILKTEPSTEKGLFRQEQFRRVNEDLHAHYKGIVSRMDTLWDYRPRDSGEQIFTRGTIPGPTFGPTGPLDSHSQEKPPNLEQDKAHLQKFREPWEIYSKGPSTYADAKKVEQQTRQLVKGYLTSPLNEVEPPAPFLGGITDEIIDRVNSRNLGQYARDFKAAMITVSQSNSSTQQPDIDPWTLEGWTLPNAEKLAGIMNKVLSLEDVRGLVGRKRQAWNTVSKNKNDFLTALREKVIRRATNSNYQIPELAGGVCDDCKHLKAERDSLLGESA
jgi:hypothetical protein